MTTARRLDTTDLEVRVKDMYREVAEEPHGDFHFETGRPLAERLGYPPADLDRIPGAAIDSFAGVGFYFDLAGIGAGETVLDLGSGSGTDSFIASLHAGPGGRVIGVDMTAQMIAKARANIGKTDLRNVEFRLGEIEHLPVADASVDVIMSNCVINLSTDKAAVFREAFRVLAPGGRVAIADIVATREIPDAIRNDLKAYAGCVSGAALLEDVEALLRAAGFEDVGIEINNNSASLVEGWSPGAGSLVVSALIRGSKPLASDVAAG